MRRCCFEARSVTDGFVVCRREFNGGAWLSETLLDEFVGDTPAKCRGR